MSINPTSVIQQFLVTPTFTRYNLPWKESQVFQALTDLEKFNEQVKFFELHPTERVRVCKGIMKGSCENPFCLSARSIAEIYGNKIRQNPKYKTEKCRYKDRCTKHPQSSGCDYAHPGDLMLIKKETENRFKLFPYEIQNLTGKKAEELVSPVRTDESPWQSFPGRQ